MRWPFICLFSLISATGFAQQYYETFTPANGLVDARVNKIMQDGSGRIFFLTRDGVSIYDGQRFINHTKIAGTPIGIVNDGMLLPDGSVRLARFSGDWIRCDKHSIDPDTILLKSIPEVSRITILPGGETFITSNHSLFLSENGSVRKIDILPVGSKKSFDKAATRGNYIVFNYTSNSKGAVYACDKTTGAITDSLAIPARDITTDKEGHVLLGIATGFLQLNKIALEKGKLKIETPWFQHLIPKGFLPENLFFDRKKNIWLINGFAGCFRINLVSGDKQFYSTADGLVAGVQSIYQDKENNYWFIAPGKGVQKLVQTNYEIVNKIGNTDIENVYLANSSEDSSLFLFTGKNMSVLKNGLLVLSHDQRAYTSPVFYWKKNYWTYASPAMLVSNSNKYVSLGDSFLINSVAHYPSPNCSIDKEGSLLLAGNCISVIKKDYVASSQALPYFADNIAVDERNNYWVFCRSNHIVKYRLVNNNLVKQAGFLHPKIGPRFVIHWNLDTFWIASRENGILITKVSDHSLSIIGQLTRQNGLSNDFVETLLKIDERRIAAGTASGLDIITLTGTDTLVENVSFRINHFEPILQLSRDDKGMIYARTENLQLFKYNPYVIDSTDYKPEAWLGKITVNGQPVNITQTIFNYAENNFLFSVTSPSFTNNRNVMFRFTLAGDKRQWQENSNKADFEISNLPPGKYDLTVTIRYPGRIYPDKKLAYHFTINPPFWKTWWFIIILVVIFILSGFYFIRSYLRKQLQKQRGIMEKELAIEQERTRMARELHDGLGSMLSGVKHSFTAMQNQLRLSENEQEKFNFNIDKLNETIKELRNITHTMAADSMLKYGLENSLQDYCQYLSQSGQVHISFAALNTGKMQLETEQAFHVFRIVQELLQNIIKHSGSSNAIIQLSYNNKRLYITVEDNGKGFEWDDALRKKGLGIKNIESRIKIVKGKIDYQSSPGKGTSVLIEVPCGEKQA